MAHIFLKWRAFIVTSVLMALARGKKGDPCDITNKTMVQQVSLGDGKGVINCDFQTESGPWILMQRRESAAVDFNRSWDEYNDGFGDASGSFWLGLKNIRAICHSACTLRVDYTHDDKAYYYQYSGFSLAGEENFYNLSITAHKTPGNGTDEFIDINRGYSPDDQQFSAKDMDNDNDNDANCALGFGGGWWWNNCGRTNVNGVFGVKNGTKSIRWGTRHVGLSFIELKLSNAENATWDMLDTSAITAASPGAKVTSGATIGTAKMTLRETTGTRPARADDETDNVVTLPTGSPTTSNGNAIKMSWLAFVSSLMAVANCWW